MVWIPTILTLALSHSRGRKVIDLWRRLAGNCAGVKVSQGASHCRESRKKRDGLAGSWEVSTWYSIRRQPASKEAAPGATSLVNDATICQELLAREGLHSIASSRRHPTWASEVRLMDELAN